MRLFKDVGYKYCILVRMRPWIVVVICLMASFEYNSVMNL